MWTGQTDLQWIDSVCRQLSRVAGWVVSFAPCHSECCHSRRPERTADYAWKHDLTTSDGCLGTICVALPPERNLDRSYLTACELADLTAQLIQRVLVERSRGRVQPHARSREADAGADDAAADAWTDSVQRILDIALRLTGFRAAALFVLDADSATLKLKAQRTCDRQTVMFFGRPLDEAPFDHQALKNGSVVIRRRENHFSEWLPEGMSLAVVRGITTLRGARGTLWVFDRRDRRLTTREEQVLSFLTSRLSEFVEQAVLIEESALQKRLRAELRIAAESQPERHLHVDGHGGWCQISGRTESAREVGGDLCEVLPLPQDRILLAVGDAAGHSIPAAMVMSAMRGALRTLADSFVDAVPSPDEIVARLNLVLHGLVESHQFMTLTCGLLDGQASTLTVSNAGHPPALLVRDGQTRELSTSGLVLGVAPDAVYRSQTIALRPGDLLAFYTDGITEAPGEDSSLFGLSGIDATVRERVEQPTFQIVEHVWDALQTHLVPEHLDDRTLLLIRFAGLAHAKTPELRASLTRRGGSDSPQ